jgi:hypothetical protein
MDFVELETSLRQARLAWTDARSAALSEIVFALASSCAVPADITDEALTIEISELRNRFWLTVALPEGPQMIFDVPQGAVDEHIGRILDDLVDFHSQRDARGVRTHTVRLRFVDTEPETVSMGALLDFTTFRSKRSVSA